MLSAKHILVLQQDKDGNYKTTGRQYTIWSCGITIKQEHSVQSALYLSAQPKHVTEL